ncbi:MAG: AlpA family phage regulatory protein [Halothiobacillaceae bacterium]|nr:AlpA family phage regulatory protein [Halothiobacillaceae bacterium]
MKLKATTILKNTDWVGAGIFPQPVKLGVRAVGWRRSEVERWLADRR